MPPTQPRNPIVCTGFDVSRQPVPVKGNPNITKIVHFTNFEGGYAIGLSVATHKPGEQCGLHNHRGMVEIFFVLDGLGEIQVGDQTHKVQRGDSVTVPVGIMHNITASPFAPLEVLCSSVVAPGHEDDKQPWLPTSA